MKIVRMFVLTAVAALFLTACSGNKERIVGKWQEVAGSERMEFLSTGDFSVGSEKASASGKYSFVEGGKLKLELGGIGALAGPQLMGIRIDGDSLALTDARGRVSTYTRIKQ